MELTDQGVLYAKEILKFPKTSGKFAAADSTGPPLPPATLIGRRNNDSLEYRKASECPNPCFFVFQEVISPRASKEFQIRVLAEKRSLRSFP